MRTYAAMPNMDLWYAASMWSEIAAFAAEHGGKKQRKQFERNLAKAQAKDSMGPSGSSRRSSTASAGS